nr:ATP-binding cassette domain-containing protein [Pseudoflavonifractor sp. An44]
MHGAPILQDVDLTLEGGTIYGFVGRNGSGKTTALLCGGCVCRGRTTEW